MDKTERNRQKRIRKRNRQIQESVAEMALSYGQDFLNSLSDELREFLSDLPHPKLPNSELTALDYITWLCGKGMHKKAKAQVAELEALFA